MTRLEALLSETRTPIPPRDIVLIVCPFDFRVGGRRFAREIGEECNGLKGARKPCSECWSREAKFEEVAKK